MLYKEISYGADTFNLFGKGGGREILESNPITQVSALRYYKLFNSIGSTELKQYEADNEHKILGYLKNICRMLIFKKEDLSMTSKGTHGRALKWFLLFVDCWNIISIFST